MKIGKFMLRSEKNLKDFFFQLTTNLNLVERRNMSSVQLDEMLNLKIHIRQGEKTSHLSFDRNSSRNSSFCPDWKSIYFTVISTAPRSSDSLRHRLCSNKFHTCLSSIASDLSRSLSHMKMARLMKNTRAPPRQPNLASSFTHILYFTIFRGRAECVLSRKRESCRPSVQVIIVT